jgi:hypothetical protein
LSFAATRAITKGIPLPEGEITIQDDIAGFRFVITTIFGLGVVSSITIERTSIVLLQGLKHSTQPLKYGLTLSLAVRVWKHFRPHTSLDFMSSYLLPTPRAEPY